MQTADAFARLTHAYRSFEFEGSRNDADGKHAEAASDARDDGSRTRTRAAAHTGRDKDHVGAFEQIGDRLFVFFCGFFSDFRIASGAESLCDFPPDSDPRLGFRSVQILHIGIQHDKIDVRDIRIDHTVYRIRSAAAAADDFNNRGTHRIEGGTAFIDHRKIHHVFLPTLFPLRKTIFSTLSTDFLFFRSLPTKKVFYFYGCSFPEQRFYSQSQALSP